MTQAKLGYQTFLQRDDGTGNFNTVIEILTLKGPDGKVDMKDATNMSSPSGVKEIIPGMEDPGQVSGDFNWVPGDPQQAGVLADKSNKTLRNWKIVFPAGFGKTSLSFSGYVSSFGPTFPVDDKITASFTIDLTGPTTLV